MHSDGTRMLCTSSDTRVQSLSIRNSRVGGEMDGEGDGQDVVVRATASKPAQDCKAAGYVVTGDPMILWKKEYIRSRAG